MRNGKKETRWMIMFAFEDQKDQKEVLKAMKEKKSIIWDNDSKEAVLTSSRMSGCIINVAKSKPISKRLRV